MWRHQALKHKWVIIKCIFNLYESNRSFVFLSNQVVENQYDFKQLGKNICIILTCFSEPGSALKPIAKISQYKLGTCYLLDKLHIQRLWRGRSRRLASFQTVFDWRLLHISKQVSFDLALFSDVLFEDVFSLISTQVIWITYEGIRLRQKRYKSIAGSTWLAFADNCSPTERTSLDCWKQRNNAWNKIQINYHVRDWCLWFTFWYM